MGSMCLIAQGATVKMASVTFSTTSTTSLGKYWPIWQENSEKKIKQVGRYRSKPLYVNGQACRVAGFLMRFAQSTKAPLSATTMERIAGSCMFFDLLSWTHGAHELPVQEIGFKKNNLVPVIPADFSETVGGGRYLGDISGQNYGTCGASHSFEKKDMILAVFDWGRSKQEQTGANITIPYHGSQNNHFTALPIINLGGYFITLSTHHGQADPGLLLQLLPKRRTVL
ncbi:hypothetical protein ACJX0J_039230 [Zea mays]